MPTASDLKRGTRIELNNDPWVVVDISQQSPSARGAATLVKTKIRNIRTKQFQQQTFKATDRITLPDFEIRTCQYLYSEGSDDDAFYFFMDSETFEQFPLNKSAIEYELGFIRENDEVRALRYNGNCIGIEIANTVELEVVECEPAVRGDTVNSVTKSATLETGLAIQVPMFVEQGQRLIVDTRDARYLRRA